MHDENSRALRIPKTHNAPGFPEGISGPELIDRMSKHAREFGAIIQTALITDIKEDRSGFKMASKASLVPEMCLMV
ncbi:NAD(P)/FAD-dependent oxidoreductase [Sphingobium indicum]|uniref:Uncharacterized protein n=2 Tax=Sphingobium indicum TaxID=332055 RepID=A0A1L5BS55_SPHIB|nr:NAD(P)/FAD-dependent oxidoreductase [Sphingobium indicum]APL95715.1 hypothetical protein SIDU_15005 [Sphingobium indicum B90A]NYI23956.1 thioredoxin reductase (NADPH) [Sphingobium indicum]RYM00105.1 NAD(P)/FAD-dependent oxidoreductase [Sphingobium indicum]